MGRDVGAKGAGKAARGLHEWAQSLVLRVGTACEVFQKASPFELGRVFKAFAKAVLVPMTGRGRVASGSVLEMANFMRSASENLGEGRELELCENTLKWLARNFDKSLAVAICPTFRLREATLGTSDKTVDLDILRLVEGSTMYLGHHEQEMAAVLLDLWSAYRHTRFDPPVSPDTGHYLVGTVVSDGMGSTIEPTAVQFFIFDVRNYVRKALDMITSSDRDDLDREWREFRGFSRGDAVPRSARHYENTLFAISGFVIGQVILSMADYCFQTDLATPRAGRLEWRLFKRDMEERRDSFDNEKAAHCICRHVILQKVGVDLFSPRALVAYWLAKSLFRDERAIRAAEKVLANFKKLVRRHGLENFGLENFWEFQLRNAEQLSGFLLDESLEEDDDENISLGREADFAMADDNELAAADVNDDIAFKWDNPSNWAEVEDSEKDEWSGEIGTTGEEVEAACSEHKIAPSESDWADQYADYPEYARKFLRRYAGRCEDVMELREGWKARSDFAARTENRFVEDHLPWFPPPGTQAREAFFDDSACSDQRDDGAENPVPSCRDLQLEAEKTAREMRALPTEDKLALVQLMNAARGVNLAEFAAWLPTRSAAVRAVGLNLATADPEKWSEDEPARLRRAEEMVPRDAETLRRHWRRFLSKAAETPVTSLEQPGGSPWISAAFEQFRLERVQEWMGRPGDPNAELAKRLVLQNGKNLEVEYGQEFCLICLAALIRYSTGIPRPAYRTEGAGEPAFFSVEEPPKEDPMALDNREDPERTEDDQESSSAGSRRPREEPEEDRPSQRFRREEVARPPRRSGRLATRPRR